MPLSWSFLHGTINKNLKLMMREDKLGGVIARISSGSKFLARDTKEFWRLQSLVSKGRGDVSGLSLREWRLYVTFPSELSRVLPVLLLSALPFAQNIVFPLALLLPKHLLSSHFWNVQTKDEVRRENQGFTLKRLRTLFREFQARLHRQLMLRGPRDLDEDLIRVEADICCGASPKEDLLIRLEPVFAHYLFTLSKLEGPYLKNLARIHGRPYCPLWSKRRLAASLQHYAYVIHKMDKILQRDGPSNLSRADLLESAILRGYVSQNEEDMLHYLDKWIRISISTQGCPSLLLHLPLFLLPPQEFKKSSITA